MGHGTPKASIDSGFTARITELEENARKLAEQFRAFSKPRPWNMPTALKTRDLLDVPALHVDGWDRDPLNRMYSETVLSGPDKAGGTVGDLIGIKWQIDFMAVEERAFRLRHASYARCAALAHGRLDGHGRTQAGIFSYLQDSVKNVLHLGAAHGAPDNRDNVA